MDAQTCLQKMKSEGTLAMATVDENGLPQIRCVSAVHYEPDALYFFTARGKEMAKQLMRDGHLQTLVNTATNEMIRMSGVAKPAPECDQAKWMDVIFEEQPYLADIYPEGKRDACVIFEVRDIVVDYFNLSAHPIERGTYALSGTATTEKGYRITDGCIACGTCASVCPQQCIEEGDIFRIQANHCLHCGACYEACPVNAIEPL